MTNEVQMNSCDQMRRQHTHIGVGIWGSRPPLMGWLFKGSGALIRKTHHNGAQRRSLEAMDRKEFCFFVCKCVGGVFGEREYPCFSIFIQLHRHRTNLDE